MGRGPTNISTVDLLLLALMVIWGLNSPFIKVALREINPLTFSSIRFVLASCVLLILAYHTGVKRIDRRLAARLFVVGLIGNGFYPTFFILGLDRTNVGITSLILASSPIFVVMLNAIMGTERMGSRGWIGVFSSFLGILLMISNESLGGSTGANAFVGYLLILIGTICWAIYTVLSRPLLSSVAPLQYTAYTVALGTPFLILLSIHSLVNQNYGEISWVSWAVLGFSSMLAIAFGYVVWSSGVQRIGSARTAIYQNISPVISILVSWQLLGERLLPLQVVGAALVFLGVYLTRFGNDKAAENTIVGWKQ